MLPSAYCMQVLYENESLLIIIYLGLSVDDFVGFSNVEPLIMFTFNATQ